MPQRALVDLLPFLLVSLFVLPLRPNVVCERLVKPFQQAKVSSEVKDALERGEDFV